MSHLEDKLGDQMVAARIEHEKEVMVIPGRRFRWDFRVGPPSKKLLVEVQGAIWVKGGHSTGTGISRDAEKLNLATLAGWRTLVLTAEMIKDGRGLRWIQEALG